MFGPRLTTVFASRWRAIWFAASMLLFAYCSVPEQSDTPENGNDALAQAALEGSPFAPDADDSVNSTHDMNEAVDSGDMKHLQAMLGKLDAAK